MTRMNDELKNLCIEITEKLQNTPGSEMFHQPVDQKKFPKYYKKIKNPKDISTILNNLRSSIYETVSQWENDVNTIWSNAKTYNGDDSLEALLAEHMSLVFQKLKRPLDHYKLLEWVKHIYNLGNELKKLSAKTPQKLGSLTNKLPLTEPMSNIEKNHLIKASEMISTSEDIKNYADILKRNEPSGFNINKEYLIIDVDDLTPESLHELNSYIKKQCAERNIQYPQ